MSIEFCKICGGLYATENGEMFAGMPCRCPSGARRNSMSENTKMDTARIKARDIYGKFIARWNSDLQSKPESEDKCIIDFIEKGLVEFTVQQSAEIEALRSLVRQACIDLNSAHDEIMILQNCPNPQDYDYPEWSSPANTIRSAEKVLGEHLAKTNNWTLFIKGDIK